MLSPKSARKADELGYTNVKVYHEGLPVWKKNKNAIYSTVNGLASFNEKDIPYVLIDARPAAETAKGVIAGAVAVSPGELEGLKGQFPKQKSAPVIIYGSGDDAGKAFAAVRGWGYKNASILNGGAEAWVHAGNSLADKAREKIAYVPKPRPGEIVPAAFRKAADTGEAGKVIVDVRGADETAAGMLKGAVNIPLTELDTRLAELPKDKDIVIHCNTGAMAEMAYNMLKDKGVDSTWLNAKITIATDGSYQIEE